MQEAVSFASHGRDHDDHVIPLLPGTLHPLGDSPYARNIADRSATIFLDHEMHRASFGDRPWCGRPQWQPAGATADSSPGYCLCITDVSVPVRVKARGSRGIAAVLYTLLLSQASYSERYCSVQWVREAR